MNKLISRTHLQLFVKLFELFILIRVTFWELVNFDPKLVYFLSYLKHTHTQRNNGYIYLHTVNPAEFLAEVKA